MFQVYKCSVQFSRSVLSYSSWFHGLQHARLPGPSPTPGAYSNCASSRWCHPTISSSVIPFSCLQSFPASGSFLFLFFFLGVFSNESVLRIRLPKYWSFSFSISPSNEHPGLISFRMDWLDLLAVQGTLKSLLQRHSSKVSILQRSVFFIVQLSHPYMTNGKTIALTRQTFADIRITDCYMWCHNRIYFESFDEVGECSFKINVVVVRLYFSKWPQ